MEIDMTTDARLISPALISQANVAGVEEKQQPHEENSTAHEKKIKYGYDELKWNNAKPLYIGNLGVPHVYETSSIEDESLEVVDQEPLKEEEMMHRIPIHAEKSALLIVDVQPEYWSACPSVRKDFPNFEKSFALTLKIARERKCKIIWVRADYRRESSPWLKQFERLSRGNKKRKDTKVELPCDPDDKEFGWEPFATPEGRESIITKTSWSSTSNTALMDILASSGIDTVLVCGLITSVCVQHSAFGVFEAGYRTLLVEDSCGDRGRARHEAALALYGGYMYELITSVDLADSETGLQMAKPIWITKRKSNIVESSSVISRNSSAASLVMTGSSHSTNSEESEGCKVTDSNKKRKVSFPEHDYYP